MNKNIVTLPLQQGLKSVTQAAEQLGVSRQRVHELIKLGRIKAIRIGHGWLVNPDTYKFKKAGRPKMHKK